jgi:hypothetical protein
MGGQTEQSSARSSTAPVRSIGREMRNASLALTGRDRSTGLEQRHHE